MRYVQETVNAISNPYDNKALQYTAMVPMDAYHMYALTNATADSGIPTEQVSAASVTMINIYSDDTVKAYYNDVEYVPAGCQSEQACAKSAFIAAVEAKAGNIELLCAQ